MKVLYFAFIFGLIGLTGLLFWKLPARHATTFDMPWRGDYNDELAISKMAQLETPESALFVTPAYFTHLKYYGKRSTYVDYKAMIHHKSILPEWYKRVKTIYQIDGHLSSTQRLSSHQMRLPTSPEGISELKSLGITHMITDEPVNSRAKLLGQKGKYFLYELQWVITNGELRITN